MRKNKSYIIVKQHINYTLNGCIMIDTRQYLIQYKDWNKIKQSIKRNKDVINYEETHFGDTLHYSTSRGKYLLSLEANLAYTMYKPSNAFTVPEPTPTDESEYDYYY